MTDTHVSVLGYSARGAVFLLVGAVVGWYAERLPRAAARGRGAEYELGVATRSSSARTPTSRRP